jgi:large subunit ribosomal protein L10
VEVRMARQEKVNQIAELKEIFKKSYGIIFTDHTGLKAEDAVVVRDRLAGVNSYLKIMKNTLAYIAAKDIFKDLDLQEVFKGPTSMIVSGEDIISTAKVLGEFSKDKDTLRVKAGLFENKFLSAEEVDRYAGLPGREVLITNLVISMNSPVLKLVNVLSAVSRNLVLTLDAVRIKKEKI